MGACNWILEPADTCRGAVGDLTASASTDIAADRVALLSDSCLTRHHPLPMEESRLSGCDVMLLGGLGRAPGAEPGQALGRFLMTVVETLKGSGSVLVPCQPCGATHQVIEELPGFLDDQNMARVPIYIVSPWARASVAYSEVLGEWLITEKQERIYQAEPPFLHSEWVRLGRVQLFDSLCGELSRTFKHPCVLFAGHPSLRFGDAVPLLRAWGQESQHALIMTGPLAESEAALAPFQPLRLRCLFFPLDFGLQMEQASQLVRSTAPKHLLLAAGIHLSPQIPGCQVQTVEKGAPAEVTLNRKVERVELNSRLAATLRPVEVPGKQVSVALFSAALDGHDGKRTLMPVKSSVSQEVCQDPPALIGRVAPQMLLQELAARGKPGAHLESTEDGKSVVYFDDEDTLIQLDGSGRATHVMCTSESSRLAVRNALIACLSQV